jgi:hypothetical protein
VCQARARAQVGASQKQGSVSQRQLGIASSWSMHHPNTPSDGACLCHSQPCRGCRQHACWKPRRNRLAQASLVPSPRSQPAPCPPTRSWEALDGELAAIGVHPHCWPLPLTLVAVREAEKNPIAQPIPQMPTVKRSGEGEGSVSEGSSVLRRPVSPVCPAASPATHASTHVRGAHKRRPPGTPPLPPPPPPPPPPPITDKHMHALTTHPPSSGFFPPGAPCAFLQLRRHPGPGSHERVRPVEAGC